MVYFCEFWLKSVFNYNFFAEDRESGLLLEPDG